MCPLLGGLSSFGVSFTLYKVLASVGATTELTEDGGFLGDE